jgi:L-ascorbate metabolism protein UlaG (beta-lactamase superfamily)
VRWLGHATVLLEVDGARLLTDPLLTPGFLRFVRRREAGAPDLDALADVDAVLISHAHQDHLHLPSLRLLPEGTRLIVPQGTGRWLERRGFRYVEEIAEGARTSVGALEVRATPAAHQGFRVPFGPSAATLGYLVQGSTRAYFAGDTELFEGMAELPRTLDGPLDLALLPVGGWGPTLRGGHMDPERAAEAARLLGARAAVPIHWGTFWPKGLGRVRRDRFALPGRAFEVAAAARAPGSRVSVLEPGAALDVAAWPVLSPSSSRESVKPVRSP